MRPPHSRFIVVSAGLVVLLVLVAWWRDDDYATSFRPFTIPVLLVVGGLAWTLHERRSAQAWWRGVRLQQEGRFAQALEQFTQHRRAQPGKGLGLAWVGVDRVALFGETGPQGLKAVWPELIEFVDRAPPW